MVHIPPALVISVYLVFHKGEPLIPFGRDKFPVVHINDEARFVLQSQEIWHHKDVGNAGEKYFQSLRYFTSDSGIFRILAEEERKLVQIKH